MRINCESSNASRCLWQMERIPLPWKIERMLVRLHPMWSGKANVSRDEPIVEITLYIDAAL
jgi:hypothetical protein